jgi:anthranilate phosphoribosyltransferase
VQVSGNLPLVDTCGTGGDGTNTFNISTTAAFVAAAAGVRVAKHGNRSVSSSCGSADVLEAAGIRLNLTPEQVAGCIEKVGVGFLFAPAHHGAMKYAIGPRREMGIRTFFNLLGPMTNPAGARRQVLGVFDKKWVRPLAQVLNELGSEHVLVVHAADGLDEISIGAETWVAEARHGEIKEYTITPEQFGFVRASLERLAVDSVSASLKMMKAVLDCEKGPATDVVLLNAGAAIYVSGLADSLEQGVGMASDALHSGEPAAKLNQLAALSATYAAG